ncbi:MAG: YggS family pyridoxal phosphate-dependent enzyme [Sulfuricaulis sp.]
MNQSSETIASNLFRVRESIAETARLSGRSLDEIRLIAVSKTQSHEAVVAAMAAGQKDFGESTTQESSMKISHIVDRSGIWHFIGHLQINKAKFIPRQFAWLHSLDSLELARKLFRLTQDKSVITNILIEVNIARDPKKHGIAPDALVDFIEKLLNENLSSLALRGLMAIGPYSAPENEIRRCFARLRELRDECRLRLALPQFTELSMGMSGDYVEAIKEGTTMVRIGSAIFGGRDYSRK